MLSFRIILGLLMVCYGIYSVIVKSDGIQLILIPLFLYLLFSKKFREKNNWSLSSYESKFVIYTIERHMKRNY